MPKNLYFLLRHITVVAFLTGGMGAYSQSSHTAADTTSSVPRTAWLDRPWELRYFLYVTDAWAIAKKSAQRFDQRPSSSVLDRQWETIFESTHFFQSTDKWAKPGDGLSVVLIEFERDGTVKTPHSFGAPLRGRLDTILRVLLAAGDHATEPRFRLGEWFMGLGDGSTHWAPGLCSTRGMPSPFSQTDTGYLYGPKFIIGSARPAIGCREWAYQLYDPDRPYIDITSYIPKRLDPHGPGTYVRQMMGWARFADEPKPVIGRHEEDWYCFHECPEGEAPGLIPDIKAWAAKNGWSAPRQPTRVPTFPDPPAKSGTYPK